ncbi:MAG: Phospholipase D1 [Thelocarpon superellum]|nr:MAG: Phospholipase D1 [Thelocarpon superellum]
MEANGMATASTDPTSSNLQPIDDIHVRHFQPPLSAEHRWEGTLRGVTEAPKGREHPTSNGVLDPLPPASIPIGPADAAPALAQSSGTSTPPNRRSVQFARPTSAVEPTDRSQGQPIADPVEPEDETPTKERKAFALFSKLKALAGPTTSYGHARSQSGPAIDRVNDSQPAEQDDAANLDGSHEDGEDSEADADAEESATEESENGRIGTKRRRPTRRPINGPSLTQPLTTTLTNRSATGVVPSTRTAAAAAAATPPRQPVRRSTMTDIPENRRAGLSEDEGRQRLERESPWRRGREWVHAARTQGTPDGRRPSNLRRLTGFVAGADADQPGSPAPWRQRAGRTTTLSAQKWRSLKAGLKLMGQRRKEESKVDHAKSAELLAELAAGTPAALMVASMFQRDDKGHKRIPILLEQLKVRLTDSKKSDSRSAGDRHQIFRIELEYGSGLTRMKWVIHRALRDFTNLHLHYKLQAKSEKYKQLYGHEDLFKQKFPRFPRTAFPYLRGARGFGSDDDEDDGDGTGMGDDETGPSGTDAATSGTDRAPRKKKRRPSLTKGGRSSRFFGAGPEDAVNGAAPVAGGVTAAIVTAPAAAGRRETYVERQRKKLELYLQQVIRHLMFRPDSNRLCKFLELSALGVRLAAEGGYHGKEGSMVIQSSKGLDFRRSWNPSLVKKRHSPKWFLVRHSYIACVDSPEEMNIYDVLLVDPDFALEPTKRRLRDKKPKDLAISAKNTAAHPQHHLLRIRNSERKFKLLAKNERQLHQFEESIGFMTANTIWSKAQRFDSFAPIRTGVHAQWLVDGRDYMWNVSRAINMARDVIYIHDWWLSPELYMRRPAAISQKWRLDRLLQRKANEGVKVFVIVYRNINSAIPIDSSYTKFSLLDLHPNVFVQRSPNQIRQNTFFWAHHEKICVVDHTVAFVGGIDLCFGRWDTPQHSVADDKLTGFEASDAPKDADHCQLWPGKDYSNPRVQDFYALDKPYEEMYDRTKVPRMPWHDVAMQIVGQPARDLTRHFVQRWNFILRQRSPTRPTPFLLPPPDFNPADLEALGLEGTCEVQILRSCCWWSMGTPDKTEHSIMNAYVKSIEQSEHFVYIENQFFISSCVVEGTRIENTVGDALVERIVRASRQREDWRAVLVIPLMPGFQNTVDSPDGTSVRLIMQCQYRSICRGETSVFGRLRAQDIEPEDYIQFYSLRTWGKIGPSRTLVTEQLYIHAKCMVVDDRVAIIGSANINERSMLGVRDSECAAIVRDADMIWSRMNGAPYRVGRFPHTLRMRLMREHLGLDVDEIMEQERHEALAQHDAAWAQTARRMATHDAETTDHDSSSADRETERRLLRSQHRAQDEILAKSEQIFCFNHDANWEEANNPNMTRVGTKQTEDVRVTGNAKHQADVEGLGADHLRDAARAGLVVGRDSAVVRENQEMLVSPLAPDGHGTLDAPKHLHLSTTAPDATPQLATTTPTAPTAPRSITMEHGLPTVSQLPALPVGDDSDIGGPPVFSADTAERLNPFLTDLRRPMVDRDCMKDPLDDAFYLDTWHAVAENNTKIYRHVFRCMPDSEVKTWKEYKEYAAYAERFAQAQGGRSKSRMQQDSQGKSGPPGQSSMGEKMGMLGPIGEKAAEAEQDVKKTLNLTLGKKSGESGLGRVQDWADDATRAQKERQVQESEAVPDEVLNEKDATIAPEALTKDPSPPVSNGDGDGDGNGNGNGHLHDTIDAEKAQRIQTGQSTASGAYSDGTNTNMNSSSQRRRRRTGTRTSRREFHASDDIIDMGDAEEMLKLTQGNLVVWPHEW